MAPMDVSALCMWDLLNLPPLMWGCLGLFQRIPEESESLICA